jgi:hypothetical protein
MKKTGLTGKPTATEAGPELKHFLGKLVETLGDYPHAGVDLVAAEKNRKKQTTRMLKATCNNPEEHAEPYIVRLSRKAIEIGLPCCPCGQRMGPRRPLGGGGSS